MGQNPSKKTAKTINADVEAIRTNLQQSKGKLSPTTKDNLERTLINYSKQIDTMNKRIKRKSIDNTQKLIATTTNELLTNNNNNDDVNLDSGAIETHSFINLTKLTKSNANNNRNVAILNEIEKAIDSLKLDINVAVSNCDNERLKMLKKSIEHLATELEMVTIVDDVDQQQKRKQNYEKILQNLYGKINKWRRQIERDGNIRYLTEYEQKQQQLIDVLIGIDRNLESRPLTIDELENLKNRLDQIDGNEAVVAKKQQTLAKFQEKHNEILIIEQKLQQSIDNLAEFHKEIVKISQNPHSEERAKAENYLKQMRDYVGKLPVINREFSEKRQQFYANLQQCSNLLSKRSPNPQRNIDGFYSYWMELQENFQPENHNFSELSSIYQLLSTLLVLIQRKLDEIGGLLQQKSTKNSPDLVKVKVKIVETPPIHPPINLQQIANELNKLKHNRGDGGNLEKSLEDYREILKNYQKSSSNELNTVCVDLLDTIDQIWANSVEKRPSTDSSGDIFVINKRINDYGRRLNDPNITNVELEAIRRHLTETRRSLIDMNPTNSHINTVVQQITKYLRYFDDNLAEMSNLHRRVNVLKEKIDRFSGTYKNVVYKQLEDDLNDCWGKSENHQQLRNEIENYLKILEEKSIKDTNYDRPHATIEHIHEKLTKIRQDVDDVINDLHSNDIKTKDDYLTLDGRLTLSILALDNLQIIKDRNLIDERENLYHEIQRYLNYINEKIVLAEQAPPLNDHSNNDDDDDDVIIVELRTEKSDNHHHHQAIDEIANKFGRIKNEINEFIGDQTNEKFSKLDNDLIEITLNLDKYKFDTNTDLNNRKLQLLTDIQNACELLDEKINAYEQLKLIEKQINLIHNKIEQCHLNNLTINDYNRLDEQLINLNVKIRKLQIADRQLLMARNDCIKIIEDCFKKLHEISQNPNGTLV